MYEHEEVEEDEGKELAKELNAIFQKTSAKESTGVDDLFIKIGKKFINPNKDDKSNMTKEEKKQQIFEHDEQILNQTIKKMDKKEQELNQRETIFLQKEKELGLKENNLIQKEAKLNKEEADLIRKKDDINQNEKSREQNLQNNRIVINNIGISQNEQQIIQKQEELNEQITLFANDKEEFIKKRDGILNSRTNKNW